LLRREGDGGVFADDERGRWREYNEVCWGGDVKRMRVNQRSVIKQNIATFYQQNDLG